jgi:hypothetical protein
MNKRKNNFSGNVGEWSELYVFLKLLAEEKLHGAKADLSQDSEHVLKILSVIREDVTAKTGAFVVFSDTKNGAIICRYPKAIVQKKAMELYGNMQKRPDAKSGSFKIPDLENFVKQTGCASIVNSAEKRDIEVCARDSLIGGLDKYGFSIKSEIGAPPTLMNASGATNVIFKVTGLTDADVAEINAIETKTKIRDRCGAIKARAQSIEFVKFQNPVFEQNLRILDLGLPSLIAHALRIHYFEDKKNCDEIIKFIEEKDPWTFAHKGIYEIKFKRFLHTIALGMKPAVPWDDLDSATGGCIIVKRDGTLVAFYVYNRKNFDNYLIRSTRFERGSTGRHGYMCLYREKDENGSEQTFIKLNLQIRFTA